MHRILVIGDFHIPTRAGKIPDWIVERIKKERFDYILCTGDLEDGSVLGFLKEIAPVKCVRGNMDWLDLPEHEVLDVGEFRIGLLHGTGIHPRGDLSKLDWYAEKMGANILIHGHTHKLDISTYNHKLFINPGTATGSWGGATSGEPETFMILEINGRKILIRKFVNARESREVYIWNGKDFKREI